MLIKTKWMYLSFFALLLSGCGGVASNVILKYQPDQNYKINYSISSASQVEVPDEAVEIMRGQIQKSLSERNLLVLSKDDDKFHKADILITHYQMRADAARLLVGIMAGCDKINSKVTIIDSNNKKIGEAEFESNECAGWGVASQVIKAHAAKIANFLSKT